MSNAGNNVDPTLQAVQTWMQNSLIFPDQVTGAENLLQASSRLSGAERLAVYQRSYYLRLLKCMQEQFPALCYALGEALFNAFAREYLQACPSESHTLYQLGKRFPGYLKTTRPDAEAAADERESWADFMVDLACFERELFVLFDAPGAEAFHPVDLNASDESLMLQPCFSLGDYRFPVAWYYHEVRNDNAPEFPLQERSLLAIVRSNYLTHTFPLSSVHYSFLRHLEQEKDIAIALQKVAQEMGKPIDGVYQSWIEPGGTREHWIKAGFFIYK